MKLSNLLLIGLLLSQAFYPVAIAQQCQNLFDGGSQYPEILKKAESTSISVIKPELTSVDGAAEYIRAYELESYRVRAFLDNHQTLGRNKPYSVKESPISDFLSVTEQLLIHFENDAKTLEQMGKVLQKLWAYSLLPQRNSNRVALKIKNGNKVVDIAADWHLRDSGIQKIIYLYLQQKNHSEDSLGAFGITLGSILSTGIDSRKISTAQARSIAEAYEIAFSKLPIEHQQDLFASYMFDVVKYRSNNLNFKKEKLIKFFEKLIQSEAKIHGMALNRLTAHLSKQMDMELGRLIIKLYSKISMPTAHAKDFTLSTVIEIISKSSKLTESEKNQLTKEAQLEIR